MVLYVIPTLLCASVYTVNRRGHGYVSFIASVAIMRVLMALVEAKLGDKGGDKGKEWESWLAAAVLCLIGTVIYGVIAGVLLGVEEPPDADFGDSDP